MNPFQTPARQKLLFPDWRNVFQGDARWLDSEDSPTRLMAFGNPVAARFAPSGAPSGIAIIVRPPDERSHAMSAEASGEPFLGIFGGTLLQDEGIFRLWYFGRTPSSVEADSALGGLGRSLLSESSEVSAESLVRYAESDDGLEWRFPDLRGISPLADRGGGHPNVVFNRGWSNVFGNGAVFIDESAPPSARYKMLYLDTSQPREDGRESDNFRSDEYHGNYALFGASSPDGITWRAHPKPVLEHLSDTLQVCEYDPRLGCYVAYVRNWWHGRRTIARTTSKDFASFSAPEAVIVSRPNDRPDEVWYMGAKTKLPGSDLDLMFAVRYRLSEDNFQVMLATSPDNRLWYLIDDTPVLTPGVEDRFDAGNVWPCPHLVPIAPDRIGLLYAGSPVPHKYPRRPPLGGLGWASWPRDRLFGVRAATHGTFQTVDLSSPRSVTVNYTCDPDGWIRIGLVDADSGTPLPGLSVADAIPLRGDSLDEPLRWASRDETRPLTDGRVRLDVLMYKSVLYAVSH